MARPREFDPDRALRTALRLFWERGYVDSSISDLADAMGIVRPSLQAAFGTKEDLYRKAIDLYGRETMSFVGRAVQGNTAYDVCRTYLLGYCDILSDETTPPGCFMIRGLVATGRSAIVARQESIERIAAYEAMLERRFVKAHEEGDLSPDIDAGLLAQTLTLMANGLATRAEMGADRHALERLAEFALTILPK